MRARQLSFAVLIAVVAGLVLAAGATAKPTKHTKGSGGSEHVQPPVETSEGALEQLPGRLGCLSSGKASRKLCGKARALKGAGPGVGSRAIAISPDGRNVYVAASGADAIAVFARNPVTGALTQLQGKAGCVASVLGRAKGSKGCGLAIGLDAPNSVAVSPDGRNVYATSRDSSAVVAFHRNRLTGELRQLPPSASGCISGLPIPGCAAGRSLKWPDVVVVSPDGKNVYVGDFAGNGVASFSRAGKAGALTQLSGTAGCITEAGEEGCAKGVELNHVEGMAIAQNGSAVYTAAAFSGAVGVLTREASTGALVQRGCVTSSAVAGCTLGYEFGGVNALTVAPSGGDVYATSLTSNSLTTFFPTSGGAGLAQPPGPDREVEKENGRGKETVPAAEGTPSPDGCTVFLRSPGCAFGVAMEAPEGLDISPDGRNVYVAAFQTGAIDVFDRNTESGVVAQKPGVRGCVAPKTVPGCTLGRALGASGSIVVSPDGRNVYSTSQKSSAVDVFRRIK
ncbi:MAG TPA: beta-propeller fold lactonase family protein [Solirubrobacterales bacterium]|nr:beta-propeller fold lactonase family protein [Solirubrobacterales bacterium]